MVKSHFSQLKYTACHCMAPNFGIMIIKLLTHSLLHGKNLFAGYSTYQPQPIVIDYHIFVMIYHQTYNYTSALSLC